MNPQTTYKMSIRAHLLKSWLQGKLRTGMEEAVGGYFEEVGQLSKDLLVYAGLKPTDYVIDVGCGSGRVSATLSSYMPQGRYLGIDISPELIRYAKAVTKREDWKFQVVRGFNIPEADNQADMAFFFSVFTHLYHEETYCYLLEAKRVLKPGGRIVFSFLDYSINDHWTLFMNRIDAKRNTPQFKGKVLDVFLSQDIVRAWAERLGMSIQTLEAGTSEFIPRTTTAQKNEKGRFWQSVCVLQKPI